jgi:tetratricopeptide (TPR) repeat protein
LLEQFRYDDAAASFARALALRPTLAIARANLAIALLNAQHLEEARSEAAAAARVLPGAAQPPYTLGLAARSLGEVEAARSAFRRVLGSTRGRGRARERGADPHAGAAVPRGVRGFQAALQAEPYSATAAYNLGLALARANRAEESQAAMDRFRKLREGYGTTLGQSYPDQGRYAEAVVSTGAERDLVDRTAPAVAFVDVTAARGGAGAATRGGNCPGRSGR